MKLGWYQFKTFVVKQYEHYERVENGDMNWIIPKKFAAFMGPLDQRNSKQRYGHHPNKYVQIFKDIDVGRVIRLNDTLYDKKTLTNNGIAHDDLFFIDGSTPPDQIVSSFM